MSYVSQKLFGTFPTFLTLKTNRNIFEIVSALPEQGVGIKVTENEWKKLPDCYYEITKINVNPDLKTGNVFGYRVWFGRRSTTQIPIKEAELRKWRLFYSEEQDKALLEKFSS